MQLSFRDRHIERKRCHGGCRGESQYLHLPHRFEEFHISRAFREESHRAADHHIGDKNEDADIKADEINNLHEYIIAEAPRRIRHQAEDTDRREHHDRHHDLDADLRAVIHDTAHEAFLFLRQHRQCEADKEGEGDDLQDIAIRQCLHRICRHEADDCFPETGERARFGKVAHLHSCPTDRRHVDAAARLEEDAECKSQDHCDRRRRAVIQECHQPDLACALGSPQRRRPADQRKEDHRHDDHLDELHEKVADRRQHVRTLAQKESDDCAQYGGYDDPRSQVFQYTLTTFFLVHKDPHLKPCEDPFHRISRNEIDRRFKRPVIYFGYYTIL